jgi:hypothetical protein
MVTVLIGGDTGPAHGPAQGVPIAHYTHLIAPSIQGADFRLLNCMRTYSDGKPVESEAPQVAQPREMADLYTNAGINGVTMANNHAWDSGPDALLDTIELFRTRGIQVTGAGRNLEQAASPVILERDGIRIGYLGVTSLGKGDSSAGADKPGVHAIGIQTEYRHRGAHAPVRIETRADPDDLADLVARVRDIRSRVDHLIVAFHSGVIRLPRVISDYQVQVCRAVVDAGADLVVCHAPHILKGVEVWKGKPIFYSIGVFAMTKPFAADGWTEPAWAHGAIRNHADLDPVCAIMPYGEDCRMSLLVQADFGAKGSMSVSFLPMQIDTECRPRLVPADSAEFARILGYMEWASVDLPHTFSVQGDSVLVTG